MITLEYLIDFVRTYMFQLLLISVFVLDTFCGAWRARIENEFSWMQLTLAGWKVLIYVLLCVIAHLGKFDGLLMFVVGREFNSLLQNIGHINDLKGIEDDDLFYQISNWFNLNQRLNSQK